MFDLRVCSYSGGTSHTECLPDARHAASRAFLSRRCSRIRNFPRSTVRRLPFDMFCYYQKTAVVWWPKFQAPCPVGYAPTVLRQKFACRIYKFGIVSVFGLLFFSVTLHSHLIPCQLPLRLCPPPSTILSQSTMPIIHLPATLKSTAHLPYSLARQHWTFLSLGLLFFNRLAKETTTTLIFSYLLEVHCGKQTSFSPQKLLWKARMIVLMALNGLTRCMRWERRAGPWPKTLGPWEGGIILSWISVGSTKVNISPLTSDGSTYFYHRDL